VSVTRTGTPDWGPLEWTTFAVLLLALAISRVLYVSALHGAVAACDPGNRRIEPWQVWLALIPLFALAWQFVVVWGVGESLGAELRARGIAAELRARNLVADRRAREIVAEEKPGFAVGMTMCATALLAAVVPFAGVLMIPATLVCWVLHWIRIAEVRKLLDPAATVSAPTATP
jgi:hypothetical protein